MSTFPEYVGIIARGRNVLPHGDSLELFTGPARQLAVYGWMCSASSDGVGAVNVFSVPSALIPSGNIGMYLTFDADGETVSLNAVTPDDGLTYTVTWAVVQQ